MDLLKVAIIKKQIITEGGAAGHMNHPFDKRDLTFGEMKEIVRLSLQGKLDQEADVTEKTDGQNLVVTFKNGKLGAARNKATIKEPMDIEGVKKKFEGSGDIEKAFTVSMKDLTDALSGLDEKTLNEIFKEGAQFVNMEIIYPATKNVIAYGPKAYLQLHNMFEYDLETGNQIGTHTVPKEIKSITQMFRGNTITIKGTTKERIKQIKNIIAQYV